MRKGQLRFDGTPEELMPRRRPRLGMDLRPRSKLPSSARTMHLVQLAPAGWRARARGVRSPPARRCRCADNPTLEDAYMALLGGAGALTGGGCALRGHTRRRPARTHAHGPFWVLLAVVWWRAGGASRTRAPGYMSALRRRVRGEYSSAWVGMVLAVFFRRDDVAVRLLPRRRGPAWCALRSPC